uniref:ORFX n=1 Tax=Cacao swollen shoot virus TaxID=31559 RepID=A0A240FXI3_9VIRU|nr:ORFX [Cacao swollen shoot virus]
MSQSGIRRKKKMNTILTYIWLICRRKKISGKKSPPLYKRKGNWNTHGGGHRRRQRSLRLLTTHHRSTQ